MSNKYPDSLKKLAVKNVLYLGQNVSDVAQELQVSKSTIYTWLKEEKHNLNSSKARFIAARLENELQTATNEREVLVKAIKILMKDFKY